ncbi:MAG: bis(5'-nucleosyl)-tetraphosphatase (symmetrical) YqeK [Candidatus Carbobacillus altaicus]|nr:bis(5'-nucleosyl)-tetraphosphatase (symmetrical) YqeK [Candidatus Carbobacillus altaicus]
MRVTSERELETKLAEAAREMLSSARYHHVEGVVRTAEDLARRYDVDPRRARLAAWLHDLCKEWPKDELRAVLASHHDTVWLSYSPALWHAPCASYVGAERFGIDDMLVLEAVYVHTTGRGAMSKLDLILWVADYIEPGRTFPEVHLARKLAYVDLEAAFYYGVRMTLLDLIEQGLRVYPSMWQAYDAYRTKQKVIDSVVQSS